MSPIEAGLGAQAAGMTTAYSSVEGVPIIYPIVTIIGLIIIALLVRRAIRKNRLAIEAHYKKNQPVISISHINDKVPIHSTGTILKIHNTEPITYDVVFKDVHGQILDTLKVEELDIIAQH